MNKGGYQILDFKNTNFTLGTGAVVSGAFKTIKKKKKPILVSGIVIAGTAYNDTYVEFTLTKLSSNTYFAGKIYNKLIRIALNDTVTISENA